MKTKIEIIATGLNFPEGPAFAPDGTLWCVELKGGNLVRWQHGGLQKIPTGGAPNGLACDSDGILWFCDSELNAIRKYDSSSGLFTTIIDQIDGKPLFMPNDLAFDPLGNLVFTNPGDSRTVPSGYVCCLNQDIKLAKIAESMYFPNGLHFVNKGEKLVIAETYKQRLWIGKWDSESKKWIDPKPFADVGGKIGPDGMALGQDGLLYVAVYSSGQIKVVNMNGEIVWVYDLPGQNPTNAAFDPSGELGLVVTEAEKGLLLSLPELGPGAPLFSS